MTETAHIARSIWEEGDRVVILDQSRLPHRRALCHLRTLDDAARAIATMQVRGAPLIGVTAAFGIALALRDGAGDAVLDAACATLAATRPTAVNLRWALARMRTCLAPLPCAQRGAASWVEARAIAAEDAATNRGIGQHGQALIKIAAARRGPVQIMTHCNAGWLATSAFGTALAPVYAAHEAGIALHVFVSETRPRNQGLLTAWELSEAGVAHTLIADNAAGHLMQHGRVDLVIVGADRIAANGDVANKIGTYLKALAARDNGVPFYVAAPASTIDWQCASGKDIPIEERAGDELRRVEGIGAQGNEESVALAPDTTAVANPAFDVTPAEFITGIVCERGVAAARQLHSLFPSAAAAS